MKHFHNVIIAGALLMASPAAAAEITTTRNADGSHTVYVTGKIGQGDEVVFDRIAAAIPEKDHVTVELTGPGGLLSAIDIGQTIRRRGFDTLAKDYCASACANIWLAGALRSITPGTVLGFHSAAIPCETGKCVCGYGTAILGAYMRDMGLNYGAIAQLNREGPDKLWWPLPEQLQQLGVAFTITGLRGR